MQEQNFESQVKQTMEEFSIPPSAPVWQKIEREIRQKKERRRMILWILPLLLAGGLWLALNGRTEIDNSAAASIEKTSIPAVSDTHPKGPLAPVDLEEKRSEEAAVPEPTTAGPTTNISLTLEPPVKDPDLRSSVASSEKVTLKNNKPARSRAATPSATKDKTTKNKTESPVPDHSATAIDTNVAASKEPEAEKPDPSQLAVNNEPKVEKPDVMIDSNVATDAPVIEPALRPRKWKISVQATGGYAQTMKSFFPLPATPESSVVPTSIGFVPRVGPSEPTPGPAFSAGIVFTNTLSTRVKFTTGIQYSYASAFQQFGEQSAGTWNGVAPANVDSSTMLYRSGNQFRYANKYHFAELPAGIDVRLFSTLPIELHGGISLSVLIASNALSFDESSDLYYHQKDKIDALGVNVFGGFSYSFAKERLKIGPHLQYNLLPVHSGTDKRYMTTGGIRARLSLN